MQLASTVTWQQIARALLLSTPSRTDRGLRQKDRASACLRADGRCPNAANRQGYGERLAGGLSLLEPAARRSRLGRPRRPNVDHTTSEHARKVSARITRLDDSPESRRAARSVNRPPTLFHDADGYFMMPMPGPLVW